MFTPAAFDYKSIAKLAGIEYVEPETVGRFDPEGIDIFPDSDLDDRTLVSFTINSPAAGVR